MADKVVRVRLILDDNIRERSNEASDSTSRMVKDFQKVAGAAKIAATAVAVGFAALATKVIQTGASFEGYHAQLTTITGDAGKAQEALDWAVQKAAQTPFAVEQIVDAYAKLSSYGINAAETITTIGDTAAGMNKDLDQAVEAFADALVGEFERLKEFGVKAKTQGDTITFSYKNASGEMVKTATQNSQEAIEQTLKAIWNEKYAGGMERFAGTWRGMWSNAQDLVTQVFNDIAQGGALDIAKNAVGEFTGVLSQMREDGRIEEFGDVFNTVFQYIADSVSFAFLQIPISILAAKDQAVVYLLELIEWVDKHFTGIGTAVATALSYTNKYAGELAFSAIETLGEISFGAGEQIKVLNKRIGDNERILEGLRDSAEKGKKALDSLKDGVSKTADSVSGLSGAVKNTGVVIPEFSANLSSALPKFTLFRKESNESNKSFTLFGDSVKETGKFTDGLKESFADAAFSAGLFSTQIEISDTNLEGAEEHAKNLDKQVNLLVDSFKASHVEGKDLARVLISLGSDADSVYRAIENLGIGLNNTNYSADDLRTIAEALGIDFKELLKQINGVTGGLSGFDGLVSQFQDNITMAVSDGIIAGIEGNDDILEAFSAMTDGLKQSFVDSFTQGGIEGVAEWYGALKQSTGDNRTMSAVGGFAGMYAAYQKRDVLGGAMAGATAGTAIFPGWGTIIGAVVGAAAAYFGGGEETPKTSVEFGMGTQVTGPEVLFTKGHQRFTRESDITWLQQQISVLREEKQQWVEALREFGDADLFAMIGDMPAFSTGGWVEMSADALARYIKETWAPAAFQDTFSAAIGAGLSALGMSEEAQRSLFLELENLPNEQRMEALTDTIKAAKRIGELMNEFSFDSIMEEINMSSIDQIKEFSTQALEQIDLQMAAWDFMSLTEIASDFEQIDTIMRQARENELQLIKQIKQLSDDIILSFNQQIESIEIGGMSDAERREYFEQRVNDLMAELDAAQSPEEVARISGEIQQYTSQWAAAYGDQLYQTLPTGVTPAEMLQNILAETRDAAVEANQAFVDESRERLEQYQDRIDSVSDALLRFENALDGVTESIGQDSFIPGIEDDRKPGENEPYLNEGKSLEEDKFYQSYQESTLSSISEQNSLLKEILTELRTGSIVSFDVGLMEGMEIYRDEAQEAIRRFQNS